MGSSPGRSLRVVLLVVALAGACSGGKTAKGAGGGAGSTVAPAAAATFTVTGTDVQAMAPQAPGFPADVSAAVKTSLDTWLGAGVVGPLQSGKPSSGLEPVFTAPAIARLSAPGPERAAMIEEGTPLHGQVHQDRANVKLTALTAPDGGAVLVTAQVDVSHTVTAASGVVAVVRSGELVLVPDRGTWRIDAFDMVTKRAKP